jgi:hypothetical protein
VHGTYWWVLFHIVFFLIIIIVVVIILIIIVFNVGNGDGNAFPLAFIDFCTTSCVSLN